ncbi:hypothetical protein [Kibdelosporangium aridum]|uniref:hypothetical protein n=1 Tax=Kibdelosporangium aridum TaxID=2030 RepID=UPI000F7AA013|nr:hypothetical protein [Kibdelosporangium aridum]
MPVVLLVGCASAPPIPADRNALVLRLSEVPSMSSHVDSAAVPEFSLYGDGRVLRPGKRDGAMLTAEEIAIDPDQAEALYSAVHDAGFDQDAEYSNPNIIDGSVIVLTLNSGGRRYTTSAANPEEDDLRFGPLLDFRQRFAEVSGQANPYLPSKVFAVGFTSGSPSTAPAWPLRSFKQAERSNAGLCLLFDAAEVAAVAPRSTWSVDGVSYDVVLRPALPDEKSCADLG